MSEKAYKTMKSTGSAGIALGILMVAAGITFGVLTIINGARLLRNKSDLMF